MGTSTVVGPKRLTRGCCPRHPTARATVRCCRCGRPACDRCVTTCEIPGGAIDKCSCGGLCSPIPVDQGDLERPSIGLDLMDAVRYPWTGDGPGKLGAGVVLFGLLVHGLSLPWVWLFCVCFLVLFLFVAAEFLADVVDTSADGDLEAPDWPDARVSLTPAVRLLAMAAGVILSGRAGAIFLVATGAVILGMGVVTPVIAGIPVLGPFLFATAILVPMTSLARLLGRLLLRRRVFHR